MKAFLTAALPWILMGLCIAVFFAHSEGEKEKTEQHKRENHLIAGLCIGMCIGGLLALCGVIRVDLGISLGMFVGELLGLLIPKKDKADRV